MLSGGEGEGGLTIQWTTIPPKGFYSTVDLALALLAPCGLSVM